MPSWYRERYLLDPASGPQICGIETTAVLLAEQSTHQQISIVQTAAFGRALVLDDALQSASADEYLYHEALVWPAMMQLEQSPEHVLILGVGVGATAREALRDPALQEATMVELDEDVIHACRKFLPEMNGGAFDDPRLRLQIQNAADCLLKLEHEFDLIVHDLTDPVDGGPSSQLFSMEFFQQCRRSLPQAGVLVVQVGALKLTPDSAQLRAIRTLKQVFEHVTLYSCTVPSFGCAWIFALATRSAPRRGLPAAGTDETLRRREIRGLRMFDGVTLAGLMHPSRLLRDLEARA